MKGFSQYLNVKSLYVIIVFGALFIYLIRMQRAQDVTKCLSFEEMVAEKVTMEDECLVNYVKNRRLSYPSKLPYNLTTRTDHTNLHATPLSSFQSFLLDKDAPWIEALIAVELFVPKRGRRHFLECGALDGVTYSTTLHLERFLNWTGILMEVDDRFYSDLEHVHRRAYGVHACASRDSHPSLTLFNPSPIYTQSIRNGRNFTKSFLKNKDTNSNFSIKITALRRGQPKADVNPGTGYVVSEQRSEINGSHVDFLEAECIPVYTALLAANITTIDLFVLDIEGVELDVLKTLPFEKVHVAVFMIEMAGKSEEEIKIHNTFFKSKGYTFYDSLHGGMHPGDDIFIKNEYYRGEEDMAKLKLATHRDIFKIITGSKDEEVNTYDLKSFIMASHQVFGHLII